MPHWTWRTVSFPEGHRMSTAGDKQRWNCPGCGRAFNLPATRTPPELCGDCLTNPPPPKPVEAAPKKAAPSPALPAPSLSAEQIAWREKTRERAFYAELAWSVTRFWFTALFLPSGLCMLAVSPAVGLFLLAVWGCVFVVLCFPANPALPQVNFEPAKPVPRNPDDEAVVY